MANNKKTAAEIAAEKKAKNQAKPETKVDETSLATVMKMGESKGLSKDSKVMLAYLVDKRWVDNKSLPQTIIDGANVVADALMADAIVTSIVEGSDTFAMIIRKDENKYLAIASMLAQQGIKVPAFNALPAPTEEQLSKAGVNLLPAETAVVTVKDSDVAKEVKEQKKKELDVAKKAITDPTKINTQEELHDALSALMVSVKNSPDERIQRAINFYQSYLKVQANKIEKEEEKNAELERINAISRGALLKEITEIVGPCPFVFGGIGKIYRDQTAQTKSPIAAFCLHRRSATNNATGKVAHDDSLIADIVKTIIAWTCNTTIEGANQTIAEQKRAIEKHKNDNTHKVAAENTIKQMERKIAEQQEVLQIINNPSFDAVDNLKENFMKNDKEDADYKVARRLVKNIADTYYKDIDIDTIEQDCLLNNCAQRGGIIINLFRDPLAQNDNYSETNILELKMVEKPAEEAATEEKNA